MITRWRLAAAIGLAMFPGASQDVGAASPQAMKGSPVVSVVGDLQADGITPLRIHSDSAVSSGSQTYLHGVDSVISQLQESNEWELSALSSTVRMMFVDFGDRATSGSPPFQSRYVPGRFVTKCYVVAGGVSKDYPAVGNMTGAGSVRECPIVFRFDYGGKQYQARMNWNAPGTEGARITCTHVEGSDQSSATALCDRWSVEPSGADGRSLARLLEIVSSKGKTTVTELGDYFMTFRIAVAKP